MSKRSRTALLLLCLVAAAAGPGNPFAVGARADEGGETAEPNAPRGPVYKNTQAGLSAAGPAGWKMAADKGSVSQWQRLVTFWDPDTSAEAVLSRRERKHAALNDLLAAVRKDWDANDELTVTNLRPVASTAVDPKARVVVDATYVVRPKAKKPTDPPPAPVTWKVSATYFLAPDAEYLLYAKAQATHWSRVSVALKRLATSVVYAAPETRGPEGEGAYRDEENGFACRYPSDYGVTVPARSRHLVQFESVKSDAPVLGIYRFPWDEALDRDVQRLVSYYVEELGGEATSSAVTVSGKPAQLLKAYANIGGRDQTILLAIVKRGSDDFFRLKAQMPRDAEASGTAVFRKFLESFELGPKPR